MSDFEHKLNAAPEALMQLREAFEEIGGTPANFRSEKAAVFGSFALAMVRDEATVMSMLLLILIIPLVFTTEAHAFPHQNRSAKMSSVTQPGDDYVWMNYYRLREGRSWMRVTRTGQVLYLQLGAPGTKEVKAVKVGNLSASRAQQLFDHLRRIEFFQLEDTVPSGIMEADILNVEARVDGEKHQVSARPPSAVPSGLLGLVDRLEAIAPALDSVTGERVLLRAQTISSERMQELRTSGASVLSIDAVSQHPSIHAAVQRPGQYVLLDESAASFLREETNGAPYFLVPMDSANVAVDVYAFRESG